MSHRLLMKHYPTATLLVAIALCLLGLPLGVVKAGPPEPTPGPASDIITKLQPYRTPGVEPFDADGWLLEEAPPQSKEEEPPVSALDQQTFQSIADATVLQGYPTLNAGDTIDMWVGFDRGDTNAKIVRGLIEFNLAGLPPNQNITKATLRVRLIISGDIPGANRTITAYRITSGWAESSVTWNNQPGYGSAYGSTPIVHRAWGWYDFDVTDLVKAWYAGAYPNYGIMLRGPEVFSAGFRGFATRESSYTPQLLIEYMPSGATPETFLYLPGVLKNWTSSEVTSTPPIDTPVPPTITATPTSTMTPTPTRTPTGTATRTPTATHTRTATPTSTATRRPTATRTNTPTRTASATVRIEDYSQCTIRFTAEGPDYRTLVVVPGSVQEINVPPGGYDWFWLALAPCSGSSSGHDTFRSGVTYVFTFS